MAHLRISNPTKVPQSVGTDRECGVEELNSLISGSSEIHVHSAEVVCTKSPPSRDVVLQPGEAYEQNFRVSYGGENVGPKDVTFRVGVKNVGHLPAWSQPLTLKIVGGGSE